MSPFLTALKASNPPEGSRRWIYVPYDQLNATIGPLAKHRPSEVGIVLIESPWKARRRPYHKQKLALILSNQRHFALEQAKSGVAVRYVFAGDKSYGDALAPIAKALGPLVMMEAAERELRADLASLIDDGLIEVLPHEGWLTSPGDFKAALKGKKTWRMDTFYRYLRKERGLLMDGGKPLGGKYSHDAANRKFWDGSPPAPPPLTFKADDITEEVGALIEAHFPDHPGTLNLGSLPTTSEDAEALWEHAKEKVMVHFGPFEDAMSRQSRTLFHTLISPVLNLHRLLPRRVVDDVAAMDIPLPSKEGFIRQVLGWREFMNHVHRETDGFRSMPTGEGSPTLDTPRDGGFEGWSGKRWLPSPNRGAMDGGADPSILGAEEPVPAAFWGTPSGLGCLDEVIKGVWEDGYGHHITRLMILSNLGTLLGISPRDLTDWFWVAYIDAYDWVVEPNVLGMGTFALGPLFTTKPYVSGSAYINKMSDYCEGCAFNPKTTCPITPLYWRFLKRHEEQLSTNPRMSLIYGTLRRRSDTKCAQDKATEERVLQTLRRGETLTPQAIKDPQKKP